MDSKTRRRLAVRAPDGVEIVGAACGAGPPLLLVYGAMMEQRGWDRLLPYLNGGRTIVTYDRRGRGESGDSETYAVEREVDDLLAFAGALPRPFDVFAHSSGALLALQAAVRGLGARRLVLYEPPLAAVREPRLGVDLPGRIVALVEAGDRDAALDLFMREGMSVPASELPRLRESPRWADQMRYVRTGAYDVTVTRSYVLRREEVARISSKTLFLLGETSPAWMRRGVETFAVAVPGSRLEVLPGQGHNAQFTAPDVLAAAVNRFLD